MRIARKQKISRLKKVLLVGLFCLFFLSSTELTQHTKAATTISEDQIENATLDQSTTTESALSDYMYGNDGCTYDSAGNKITCPSGSNWFENGILAAINGITPLKAKSLKTKDGQEVKSTGGAKIYIQNQGALGSLLTLNDQMKNNPPASGVIYAQGEWNKITQGYKAEAASTSATNSWVYYPGLGYSILKPIQGYWIVARNIAYIAMIFIMVLVAFLVAFRSNFGGQTQVTIANSIPNIILALVMISISFPLSGFVIDLVTIGTNAAQQVLVQNTFSPGYEDVWNSTDFDILVFSTGSTSPGKSTIEDPKNNLQPDDSAMSVWNIFSTTNINVANKDKDVVASIIPAKGGIGSILETVLGAFAKTGVANVFFQLVFVIAAFMASLKLFFKLLSKYLTLILYPIISPFLMLTIAIPGRGAKTITNYFRTLISAALAFVAVYAVFLFIIVLGHDESLKGDLTYMPPLMGYSAAPSGGGAALGDYLRMLLGFGLFLATPAIPDVIDSSLNVISFNEVRSGQVVRNEILQGGGTFLGSKRPSGFAGGLSGARNITGRAWKGIEGQIGGFNSDKEQKR